MAAVAVASQQLRPPKYLVNRSLPPPPVGALSCVFQGPLPCKSIGCILDKKNQPIGNKQILDVSLDLSRKTLVANITNIHV